MNVCQSTVSAAFPRVRRALGPGLARRLAGALAAWRDRMAAPDLPLDARTLRDIGVTPQGVRLVDLAGRNEARRTR